MGGILLRRNRLVALATASLVGAAMLPLTASQVGAAPAPAPGASADSARDQAPRGHVINTPEWAKKYDAINREALEQRLRTGGSGAAEKVAKGQFGRVATTGKEKIFVVLAEFGNTRHPSVPDDDGTGEPESDATTFEGPLHGDIPKPNRRRDNSTLWQDDYDRSHYTDMYFNRMRKFYERESNGKFTFDGQVTEWVKVPFNQARYGRNDANTIYLVRDALAFWVDAKLDAGWSMERTTNYLKSFDEVDRYDFDDDGDFKEPDGFIDQPSPPSALGAVFWSTQNASASRTR
jgi:immune inhibitor A